MKLKPNQILLSFKDKEEADYVKLVSRRKGWGLEGYILDNFEWDDKLPCVGDDDYECSACEYLFKCPDAKVEE